VPVAGKNLETLGERGKKSKRKNSSLRAEKDKETKKKKKENISIILELEGRCRKSAQEEIG